MAKMPLKLHKFSGRYLSINETLGRRKERVKRKGFFCTFLFSIRY